MKSKTIGWIILAAGAAALLWWWRSRQQGLASSTLLPGGMGTSLAGSPQQSSGIGSLVTSGSQVTTDSPKIVSARGLYGEQARCNAAGGRFIKTITPPAYGICVSSTVFTKWATSNTNPAPTADDVIRFLNQPGINGSGI